MVMRGFKVAMLLIWLFWSTLVVAAGVNAQLERDRIREGESVRLILTITGMDDPQVDLSPLNAEFEVLGKSQSSQYSMINGKVSSEQNLIITLRPQKSGRLTIPALSVGQSKSSPLTLTVLVADAASGTGREVFVEMAVEPGQTCVQCQTWLTVRLYYSRPIAEGSLSEPTGDDGVVVERLGKDEGSEVQKEGKAYHMLERRYALFPQKSGLLKIPGVRFQGQVVSRQGRSSVFGRDDLLKNFFGGQDPFQSLTREVESVVVKSPDQEITVAPAAADAKGGWWLPAEEVTLTEAWNPQSQNFRVGEPVVRNLVLRAKGQMAQGLPQFSPPAVEGVKIYPDQPQLRTQVEGAWVVGEREEKWAMTLTHAGAYTLPGVDVPWWNTRTRRMEHATLPPRSVTVLPEPGAEKAVKAEVPQPLPVPSQPVVPSVAVPESVVITSSGGWPWVSGVLLVAWGLTGWMWYRERRARHFVPAVVSNGLAAVEKACRGGDGAAAQRALLAWGGPRYSVTTLRELGQRLGPPVPELLEALDCHLFQPQPGASRWEGLPLWLAIRARVEAPSSFSTGGGGSLPAMDPGQV